MTIERYRVHVGGHALIFLRLGVPDPRNRLPQQFTDYIEELGGVPFGEEGYLVPSLSGEQRTRIQDLSTFLEGKNSILIINNLTNETCASILVRQKRSENQIIE